MRFKTLSFRRYIFVLFCNLMRLKRKFRSKTKIYARILIYKEEYPRCRSEGIPFFFAYETKTKLQIKILCKDISLFLSVQVFIKSFSFKSVDF